MYEKQLRYQRDIILHHFATNYKDLYDKLTWPATSGVISLYIKLFHYFNWGVLDVIITDSEPQHPQNEIQINASFTIMDKIVKRIEKFPDINDICEYINTIKEIIIIHDIENIIDYADKMYEAKKLRMQMNNDKAYNFPIFSSEIDTYYNEVKKDARYAFSKRRFEEN